MDRKTIGILGATGYVGQEAYKTINNHGGFNIILGCRNIDKLKNTLDDKEIKCIKVNILDKNEIQSFCQLCDIVINCTGPSSIIVDKVAEACIVAKTDYIDVSGGETLYKKIKKQEKEIADKKLKFILAGGIYPGLTEIFPSYICEKYFDHVDKLELMFLCKGKMSYNAAYDFVCGIEDDNGLGMRYCLNAEAVQIKNDFYRSFNFKNSVGEVDTYPVLNQEFIEMVREKKITEAYFYNTFLNKSLLASFIKIKSLKQYKTEEEKHQSAQLILEQYKSDDSKFDDFVNIHINVSGNRKNRNIKIESDLIYQNNGSLLSGITAADIAINLSEDNENKYGCFLTSQRIDNEKIMRMLMKQGGVIKNRLS